APWQETAVRTRLASHADYATLGAFEHPRPPAPVTASEVHGAFSLAIWIERPLDGILGEAVPKHSTRVVQDDGVSLAVGRAQHPTDHLAIQTHFACGPRQNAAAHFRHIPALGQHHAVGDEFGLARFQTLQNFIALLLWRSPVYMLGPHAGPDEL